MKDMRKSSNLKLQTSKKLQASNDSSQEGGSTTADIRLNFEI
jgi:hypothetical protein